MPGPVELLTCLAVTDGRAAWQAVVSSFRETLDDPFRGLPVVAAVAGFFLIVWLNCRAARWVLRRWGSGES